jgi:hypothetical protein
MSYLFKGAIEEFSAGRRGIAEFGVEHDFKKEILWAVGDLCVAEGSGMTDLAE